TVFRGARFHNARMTMSDLSECDASNAKLDRAVLKNALLIRTTLNHASARGVNLNEALLTNARIAGADFTGAQLTRADFMGAVGDDKTRFTEAVVAWTRFDAKASKGAST
ncbi:MAG: pentapeptide repeat-containing protein, partial [Myxococcales bacterium]|nr:pentapeptide repeat-containing protein [Myxococcales bacterium]